MITFNDACNLMEAKKLCAVRIYDLHNNLIVAFDESTNVAETVNQIRAYEDLFTGYGKLIFKVANAAQQKSNFKGAAVWTVGFNKNANNTPAVNNNAAALNPFKQMEDMFKMFTMFQTMGFAGNAGASKLEIEIEKLKLNHDHEKRMRELNDANKDPVDKYAQYMPFVMSALGKDDATIEKMINWGIKGKALQAGSQAIAGAPTATTLTFKDVERMTEEAANKKIAELINSVLTKVKASDLIIFMNKLADKPTLAETAVNALSLYKAGDPVKAEIHAATKEDWDNVNLSLDRLADLGEKGVSAFHMITLLQAVDERPEILAKALPLLANL